MKVKELALSSVLIAALIAQNYILYSFPITLTYVVLYILANKIKSWQASFIAIILFVTIKNIVWMAFPTTIIADLIGLLLFMLVCKIKKKWLSYIVIVLTILFHLLLLDFSIALMTNNPVEVFIANFITGFIVYIYAPLSIVLITLIDGLEVITNYEID